MGGIILKRSNVIEISRRPLNHSRKYSHCFSPELTDAPADGQGERRSTGRVPEPGPGPRRRDHQSREPAGPAVLVPQTQQRLPVVQREVGSAGPAGPAGPRGTGVDSALTLLFSVPGSSISHVGPICESSPTSLGGERSRPDESRLVCELVQPFWCNGDLEKAGLTLLLSFHRPVTFAEFLRESAIYLLAARPNSSAMHIRLPL